MKIGKLGKMAAALGLAALLTGCGSDGDVPLNQMKVEKYVTLGDYQNLSVTVDAAAVDDTELAALVNSVYVDNVTAENGGIVDRAVETGDTVIIDYEGKKDGVAFEGGTAQGASLTIGSGRFIDGFEDGLIGVKPGETVDLNLTFPESYGNAELAGQPVVFTVTVHFIRPAEVAPEDMEDAVVASMGIPDVNTVEELQQYAYDYLYSNAETNYSYSLRNGIMDALMAQCVFSELPEELVENYRVMIQESIESNAAAYGVTADVYAGYFYGMTSAQLVEVYAEETLKQDLAMQAIANTEGLGVSDEELQEMLLEYAQEAGYSTVEEYLGGNSQEEFRNYFMNERVMEYLIDKASVTENQ